MRTQVVKILVRDPEKGFLAVKKSSGYDSMGDKWEQPGGKIEEGENRFQAAKREIKAETGLEAENFEDLLRLELEAGETVECYILYTEKFSGNVELSQEHQDFNWVDRREARNLDWHRDASYIVPVIRYLEKYRTRAEYGESPEVKVVKTLIQNAEGKFLAVRKSLPGETGKNRENKKYREMGGKWELPGGRIKEDRGKPVENRYEAADREIREELGLEPGEPVDVVREEIEKEKDVNVYILMYPEEEWSGRIELSREHSESKWISPEEYLEMDWHADAGYGYPPMKFLDEYLKEPKP